MLGITMDIGTVFVRQIEPELIWEELQWHPYGTVYRIREGWPTRDAAAPQEDC